MAWRAAPFWLFSSAYLVLLALYQIAVVLPRAYLSDATATISVASLTGTTLVGVFIGRGAVDPVRWSARSLTILSVLSAAAPYGYWLLLPHGDWLRIWSVANAAVAGIVFGLSVRWTLRAYGPSLVELGAIARLLDPLGGSALATACVSLLIALPWLGLLRSGALLSALVTCCALSARLIAERLELARAESRELASVLSGAGAALVAAVAAPMLVSLSDVAQHSGHVLYVSEGERGRHVLVRVQQNLALFSNDVLAATTTDTSRFAESLTVPALAGVPTPRRVLLFSPGLGAAERAILAFPGVERLVSVVPDARLGALAEKCVPFHELGGGPILDPRHMRIEAEAASFVARATEPYDVILADFGDPTSYLEGKHYSRHFLAQLRTLLTPEGYFALQITSPLRTPRAHASVLATLRAAGYAVAEYRAPLPTLGEWGFALARRLGDGPIKDGPLGDGPREDERGFVLERLRARVPAKPMTHASFATHPILLDLFARPPESRSDPTAPVNYLYEQPVVELYQEEERALWE